MASKNIKDPKHQLINLKKYDKSGWTGMCSCGLWAAANARTKGSIKKYHQGHVNVASNL